MSLNIAVGQFAAGKDKAANFSAVADLITQAAAGSAKLVVLPEYSMYLDLAATEPLIDIAEAVDGEFVTGLGQLAKENSIWVLAGMIEQSEDVTHVYNTLVLIDPDGAVISTYRKLHLFDAFGFAESDTILAGEIGTPMVFTIGEITFGAMTCYDLRFPELARVLVDAGATALVVSAAWAFGPTKESQWVALARARAIENTSYVVGSGQTAPSCCGQSLVVDPMGSVISSAGDAAGVAFAALDPQRVIVVRAQVPALHNRRFTVVPR